jgi:molybdate transport system substrate-binding protein
MNNTVLAVILITTAFLIGCSGSSGDGQDEILVFAAASVTNALNEAVESYERATGVNINISYAGSQILAQQIASGAPAQVFISAGESPVEFLRGRGLVDSESALVSNKLVAITKRSLTEQSLAALLSPNIERIALADPDVAPAGTYSREALRAAGLWESLQPKIVLGQDVRATMAFVEAGNADIALVYITDAAVARGVETLDIVPHDSYGPIVYPVVTVKSDESTEAADAFVQFLLSPDAQEIFRSNGFEPVR